MPPQISVAPPQMEVVPVPLSSFSHPCLFTEHSAKLLLTQYITEIGILYRHSLSKVCSCMLCCSSDLQTFQNKNGSSSAVVSCTLCNTRLCLLGNPISVMCCVRGRSSAEWCPGCVQYRNTHRREQTPSVLPLYNFIK